jgi:adenylate kinase
LNIEHVSPLRLVRPENSRRPVHAASEEANTLALMRRWFFARKPDAGFVLHEFPATLLQAIVFDEWLDARDESLHGVLVGASPNGAIVEHYRTLGLIYEPGDLAA